MPLALVSDIHGSDTAFAAVAADLEQLGVDRAICLGDAVQGGDQPREVLDRLAALGALFVNPGSVRDEGAFAIVTGGSVEFRRTLQGTA